MYFLKTRQQSGAQPSIPNSTNILTLFRDWAMRAIDVYKRQAYDRSDFILIIKESTQTYSQHTRNLNQRCERRYINVILQISKMYYLGQVTAEQIMLIKANIDVYKRQ